MPPPPWTVLIAEDHESYREGVVRAFDRSEHFDVVGAAVDGVQTLEMLRELRPGVARSVPPLSRADRSPSRCPLPARLSPRP